PDRLVEGGQVEVSGGIITAVREGPSPAVLAREEGDLRGGYLVPGFVDLHVHGGPGADFMGGTEEAFRPVCRAPPPPRTTSPPPPRAGRAPGRPPRSLDTSSSSPSGRCAGAPGARTRAAAASWGPTSTAPTSAARPRAATPPRRCGRPNPPSMSSTSRLPTVS